MSLLEKHLFERRLFLQFSIINPEKGVLMKVKYDELITFCKSQIAALQVFASKSMPEEMARNKCLAQIDCYTSMLEVLNALAVMNMAVIQEQVTPSELEIGRALTWLVRELVGPDSQPMQTEMHVLTKGFPAVGVLFARIGHEMTIASSAVKN